MKFFMTMNMPSNQGRAIHQMIVECKNVNTIESFWAVISKHDFIIVDEFYFEKDPNGVSHGYYKPRGPIIVNSQYVGKIRQVSDHAD